MLYDVLTPAGINVPTLLVNDAVPLMFAKQATLATIMTLVLLIGGVVTAPDDTNVYEYAILDSLGICVI
jgi:hypothetical protein